MEFYEINNQQVGVINQVHKLLKLYHLDIAVESKGIFAISSGNIGTLKVLRCF